MFDDIMFTTYGRGRIDKKWSISDNIGFNRLYYIHSGEVFYCGDGKYEPLKEGNLYLFPQNIKFELDFESSAVIDHTYFDFVVMPPMRMDSFIEIDMNKNKIIGAAAKIMLLLGEKYPFSKSEEYKELIKSYMKNLLVLIDKEVGLGRIEDERINNVIKYIHKNISSEITLDKLAEISCTEKNYFIKLFKKNMLITPHRYIKNYRLTIAASYLGRKESVKEIAEKIGYSDTAAFSKAFKNAYGIYPSEYVK